MEGYIRYTKRNANRKDMANTMSVAVDEDRDEVMRIWTRSSETISSPYPYCLDYFYLGVTLLKDTKDNMYGPTLSI